MFKNFMKGLIKMIRGITYDKQLFKSNDFALMTRKLFSNKNGKVTGCNLSTNGNTIIIGTGWFIASGYYTNISTREIIEATQSGTLVYEIDLSQENTIQSFNQGSFKIITGNVRQDDLFDSGTIYQLPIAEITTDGTTATITETLWSDIRGQAITDDKFVVIDGIMTLDPYSSSTASNNRAANTSVDIDYPTGFNKNNTFCISIMLSNNAGDRISSGSLADCQSSIALIQGALPRNLGLYEDKMKLTVGNYATSSINTYYQILLMKIDTELD